jgi:PIN domain nuclease of toxin-antitoxin system
VRILLDTQAFLWFVLDDPKLSATAPAQISDPANDVLVSPATYWEVAIKISLKKLDLHSPYEEFMKKGIDDNQFQILAIETRHTAAVATMPFHHRDPFDRLIAAQALVERIALISNDPALDAYGVDRLW